MDTQNKDLATEREHWLKLAQEGTLPSASTEPDPKVEAVSEQPKEEVKNEVAKEVKEVVTSPETKETVSEESNNTFEEPDFVKAKKEKDTGRLDRNWKKLDEEKAQVRKLQNDLQTQMQSYREQARKEVEAEYLSKRPDITHFDKSFWDNAATQADLEAKKHDDNGDYDAGKKCRDDAYAYRNKGLEVHEQTKEWRENTEKSRKAQEKYQLDVKAHKAKIWADLQDAHPELKDSNSPLMTEVLNIWNRPELNKMLGDAPNGEHYAVEWALNKQKADSASTLEKKVQELQAKLAKAEEKLNPATSYNQGSYKGQSIENLPLDQQREYFKNQRVNSE